MRAVSSSFSDCSSSLEVSNSSFVDCNSSFTDMASSLEAISSSLVASKSWIAPSSSFRVASSSCSSCVTRGGSPALEPFLTISLLLELVGEADQEKPLAAGLYRHDRQAYRHRLAVTLHPSASGRDRRLLSVGFADHRAQLGAQALARHREEVPAGLASGDLQVTVDRSEVEETLVPSVDQDRGRRIGVQQRLSREICDRGARRR